MAIRKLAQQNAVIDHYIANGETNLTEACKLAGFPKPEYTAAKLKKDQYFQWMLEKRRAKIGDAQRAADFKQAIKDRERGFDRSRVRKEILDLLDNKKTPPGPRIQTGRLMCELIGYTGPDHEEYKDWTDEEKEVYATTGVRPKRDPLPEPPPPDPVIQ